MSLTCVLKTVKMPYFVLYILYHNKNKLINKKKCHELEGKLLNQERNAKPRKGIHISYGSLNTELKCEVGLENKDYRRNK